MHELKYLTSLLIFYRYNRTLLERAVNDFNIQNGAQNQVVTNAIFTHGALDPLLAHGIVDYNIDTSQAILTSCKWSQRMDLWVYRNRNKNFVNFSARQSGGFVFNFWLWFRWFISNQKFCARYASPLFNKCTNQPRQYTVILLFYLMWQI